MTVSVPKKGGFPKPGVLPVMSAQIVLSCGNEAALSLTSFL